MQGTGSMLRQQPPMVLGGISLVVRETIFRIYRMHLIHIMISSGLGENGGRADGRMPGIAADDGARRQRLAEAAQLRHAVAVDQHMIRRPGHRQNRAVHGKKRSLQNVQRVDLGLVRPADAETQCFAADDEAQAFSFLGVQLLRVGDSRNRPSWPQNHRSGNHRTGEGPAAGLIDAGDVPHVGPAPARRSPSSARMACAARLPAPRRSCV